MFLILKTTDWKEEDYINHNIVPFGWCELSEKQCEYARNRIFGV